MIKITKRHNQRKKKKLIKRRKKKEIHFSSYRAYDKPDVLKARALINRKEAIVVLDSAAVKSFINKETAKLYNIKSENKKIKQLYGLGDVIGQKSKEYKVRLGEREIPINFYTVKKEKLPILISRMAFVKFNAMLNLLNNTVADATTYTEICKAFVTEEGKEVKLNSIT